MSWRGLILHKLVNTKDYSAAQGGSLCKEKFAGSGQFMQNQIPPGLLNQALRCVV